MRRLLLMLGFLIAAPAFAVFCGYNPADVIAEFLIRPIIASFVVVAIVVWAWPSRLEPGSEDRDWKAEAFFFALFLPAYGYVLIQLHHNASLRFGWLAMPAALVVEFSAAQLWLQKKSREST